MTGFTVPNHTQTPNALFDDFMKDMTEAELKVTLAIIRKTLGYHKQQDPISWSQIMSMTGLSKDATQNGIDRALKRGLIEIAGHGKRGVNIFGLVLNPDQSEISTSSGTNKIPVDGSTGTKLRHTKESIKETSQKNTSADAPIPSVPTKPKTKPIAPTTEQCKALINAWVESTGLIDIGASYDTKARLKKAKEMLLWSTPITADEIRAYTKWLCEKKKNTEFNFFLEGIPLWRSMNTPKPVPQKDPNKPMTETEYDLLLIKERQEKEAQAYGWT